MYTSIFTNFIYIFFYVIYSYPTPRPASRNWRILRSFSTSQKTKFKLESPYSPARIHLKKRRSSNKESREERGERREEREERREKREERDFFTQTDEPREQRGSRGISLYFSKLFNPPNRKRKKEGSLKRHWLRFRDFNWEEKGRWRWHRDTIQVLWCDSCRQER